MAGAAFASHGEARAASVRAAEKEAGAVASEEAGAASRISCANSFRADTLVATPDGEKPISELKIGDHVLAYDQTTGITGSFTVTAVLVHLDPTLIDLTIDGELIETTPEHPFFTLEHGWVNAGELRRGEHVRTAAGSYGTVQADLVVQRSQVMYNLTIVVAHSFFVGDGQWLVHNTECASKNLPQFKGQSVESIDEQLKDAGFVRTKNQLWVMRRGGIPTDRSLGAILMAMWILQFIKPPIKTS